jgi:transketolase C-terminal domain/subunit
MLGASGIDVSIYSCPSICPLPVQHLSELAGKAPLIVVEEHVMRGGLYSSILEELAEQGRARGVRSVSVENSNLKLLGDQEFLRKNHGLTSENIIKQFNAALEELSTD